MTRFVLIGRRSAAHVAGAVVLLALASAGAAAQTVEGRVLDQSNERPVGGAIVALVDPDGDERARVLADSVGRFRIAPPEAGEFHLVAQRFGYYETRSPLIAMTTDGLAALDLMLVAQPIGIEGLEVSVEELAVRELQQMGLSPRQLGNRWIDRETIDAIPVKRDMGTILERTAQASMRVIRPENLTLGSDDIGLCISLLRARTAGGRGTCSLIVLDGIPITGTAALDIDPDAIESVAVLEPIEATTFYGTIGGSGAVLVWTRRGR